MPVRILSVPVIRGGWRVALLGALTAMQVAAQLPRAVPNDNRTAAGRMVDGELHVTFEAVLAEWRPRGENGPVLTAAVFAEEGGQPQAPGPMIRVSAGTPIRLTIRNTLDRPIRLGGLGDRPAADPDGPPFFAATQIEVAPGESHEAHFTPPEAMTSFYLGGALGPPEGRPESGMMQGVFIVDPVGATPHPDERIMIFGVSFIEGGSPSPKLFINGRSWPHTERLNYTVGDTVRWRVINPDPVQHPMHLHGFHFSVEARGDGMTDRVYVGAERPLVVTELMEPGSTLTMSWVPTEPGNWLFHCHLLRHMGGTQLFEMDREARGGGGHPEHEHDMAGLVMGITVRLPPGHVESDPAHRNHIALWTGSRPNVFGDAPALGFIAQEGAVPPPDSSRIPGSTLVLRRGEPTSITVHNRLDFPLSVHWHGLELRSLYDGVGGWSGHPGAVRPGIAPGDSAVVLITPPKAGTFMYHTHGEPGTELTQGLYGSIIVLEPGENPDPDLDRLYMLGSRGAEIDATPAVNGHAQAPHERFAPGNTARLRFAHISADELKTVRLLRDGQEVQWRARAKDGADLPPHRRVDGPARFNIGVGETYDVEWTPEPGVYVLEVRTRYYPGELLGGPQKLQRVGVGVGAVTDSALDAAVLGTDLTIVDLDAAALAQYTGFFADPSAVDIALREQFRFFISSGRLVTTDDRDAAGLVQPAATMLALGDHVLAFGQVEAGAIVGVEPGRRARFIAAGDSFDAVEILQDDAVVSRLERIAEPAVTRADLERLVGEWAPPGAQFSFTTVIEDDQLVVIDPGGGRNVHTPVTATRFLIPAIPGFVVEFEKDGDAVVTMVLLGGDRPPQRYPRKE